MSLVEGESCEDESRSSDIEASTARAPGKRDAKVLKDTLTV